MKDLKISKELLSEVLAIETETLSKEFSFTLNDDYIEFSDDGEMQFEYCIYKFAFKCKEWAYKKGYSLVDGIDTVGSKICYIMEITGFSIDYYYEQTNNYVDVFKACEWILSKANK